MEDSESGLDVYGEAIPVQKPKDAKLLFGKGVQISADGLKVTSKIDGRPVLSFVGKLSVEPELSIEGDVSFETGNITFAGRVTIAGIIQDGFSVKAGSITVREIGKATIEATGDVTVYGGILGATIRAQGNVKAVHIHTSRVTATGDIIVDKGIVDSKIVASGRCVVTRGKILTSHVTAKRGIEAAEIGSDRAAPCTLFVGIDPAAQWELEKLKDKISQARKDKRQWIEAIQNLQEQMAKLEIKIGENAQVQDRSVVEQRMLKAQMEEASQKGDAELIAQLEAQKTELNSRAKAAEVELEKLFDQQDIIRDKISAHQKEIQDADELIGHTNQEVEALTDWMITNQGSPTVKVQRTAYSGTTIRGPSSTLVLKSDCRSAMIKEIKALDRDGEAGAVYRMTIQSLY